MEFPTVSLAAATPDWIRGGRTGLQRLDKVVAKPMRESDYRSYTNEHELINKVYNLGSDEFGKLRTPRDLRNLFI